MQIVLSSVEKRIAGCLLTFFEVFSVWLIVEWLCDWNSSLRGYVAMGLLVAIVVFAWVEGFTRWFRKD